MAEKAVHILSFDDEELSLVLEGLRTRCAHFRGIAAEPHQVSAETRTRWTEEARRYGRLHEQIRRRLFGDELVDAAAGSATSRSMA